MTLLLSLSFPSFPSCAPPIYLSMYLKPLRPQLEEMEECEYGELEQKFPPLFHTISLVWAHSKYFRQPARLVVLLQEISNLIVELVTSSVHAYTEIGVVRLLCLVSTTEFTCNIYMYIFN